MQLQCPRLRLALFLFFALAFVALFYFAGGAVWRRYRAFVGACVDGVIVVAGGTGTSSFVMRDGGGVLLLILILILILLLNGAFELERGDICVALCACVFWDAKMVVWLERCFGVRVVQKERRCGRVTCPFWRRG